MRASDEASMNPVPELPPVPDPPSSRGLTEAWAEAAAAMPDRWHVSEIKSVEYRGDGERWMAMAWEHGDDPDYRTFLHGYGNSPIEALDALTAQARGSR